MDSSANLLDMKETIIYDGECNFCISQINRIKAWDKKNCFNYMKAKDENLATVFPILKQMNLEEGMRLVTPSGKVFVGADAVYHIARKLSGPNLIAWLYLLPVCNQIAKLIYAWIADRRRSLGKVCTPEKCKRT